MDTLTKNFSVSTTYVDHPCKIQHGFLGRSLNDDKPIIKYFKDIRKQNPEYKKSDLSSWRTDWEAHIEHHDILNELMMDIIRWHNLHVMPPRNDYIHEQLKAQEDFDIDAEVWYTEYDVNDKADEHHHGQISRTSFVYYLDCEPGGSPLTFVKKAVPQYGLYQSVEEFDLQTYPGMIVFFPSFLHHKVYPTTSKRYVLAGNINDIIYKTPDA